MADFVEEENLVAGEKAEVEDAADDGVASSAPITETFDFSKPLKVVYCPTCSMPPEFCEYGQSFDKCLPWIMENCREAISPDVLATLLGDASLEDGDEEGKKKKKGAGAGAKKVKAEKETKVVIARVQRQKKKFVTAVAGLETVPDLKIKDAAKVFGKKFSSGSSVSEAPNGTKEVVIQGDVTFDLPPLLISEFKVPPTAIYFLEDDRSLRPYA